MTPAIVVLGDGRTFEGVSFAATGTVSGEVVCATGMTGYQEVLTNPASRGQLIAMTAPHIGNTGVCADDTPDQVWAGGLIVREISPVVSNWRASGTLETMLSDSGVIGIRGVDTRALARHVRGRGAFRAVISTQTRDVAELMDRLEQSPALPSRRHGPAISDHHGYTVEPDAPVRATIAAIDMGVTEAALDSLVRAGARIRVVPAAAPITDVVACAPDGIYLSSGPGDPAAADDTAAMIRQALERRIPVFGTGLGFQILARALGYQTYRLDAGHHGLNHPVRDLARGGVLITSHHHDYAVSASPEPFHSPFGEVTMSHVSLNDGVVEGLTMTDRIVFGVQFDPGGHPGPHDAAALFADFIDRIAGSGGQH